MEGQEIVILDEPFNALDESACQYLYQFIRQLRDEEKTILITSHNQTDLDELCDVQDIVFRHLNKWCGGILIQPAAR